MTNGEKLLAASVGALVYYIWSNGSLDSNISQAESDTNESSNSPPITNLASSWGEPDPMSATPTALQYREAFLKTIQTTEGTYGKPDPYLVLYAFDSFPWSYANGHPRANGWPGVALSDSQCRNAGLNPPCKSTAAGAYQINYPTFLRLANKLGTGSDFTPATQDAMALELCRERGALGDIDSGDVQTAARKCSSIWASLPGSTAGQNPVGMETVNATFGDLLSAITGSGVAQADMVNQATYQAAPTPATDQTTNQMTDQSMSNDLTSGDTTDTTDMSQYFGSY
jgi:muramidase (phage lysozyme)